MSRWRWRFTVFLISLIAVLSTPSNVGAANIVPPSEFDVQDSPILGGIFLLNYDTDSSSAHAPFDSAYISKLEQWLEESFFKFNGTYQTPTSPFRVFVYDFAVSDPQADDAIKAFVRGGNELHFRSVYHDLIPPSDDAIRATVFHELFHVFQGGYATGQSIIWWKEATARAVEFIEADFDDDVAGAIQLVLSQKIIEADLPFDYYGDSLPGYSRVGLVLGLNESDPQAIRKIFENLSMQGSNLDVWKAIEDYGASVPEELSRVYTRHLAVPSDVIGPTSMEYDPNIVFSSFSVLPRFSTEFINVFGRNHHYMDSRPVNLGVLNDGMSKQIPRLSARYFRIERPKGTAGDTTPYYVEIERDGPDISDIRIGLVEMGNDKVIRSWDHDAVFTGGFAVPATFQAVRGSD